MNIHKQYNLMFRIVSIDGFGKTPICEVSIDGALPHLEGEISSFINNNSDYGLIEAVIEDLQSIIDGSWTGSENDGDNIFVTDTNETIKLDLNDGYAYLGDLTYGWATLPRILLPDLKSIFEEWITFKNNL